MKSYGDLAWYNRYACHRNRDAERNKEAVDMFEELVHDIMDRHNVDARTALEMIVQESGFVDLDDFMQKCAK